MKGVVEIVTRMISSEEIARSLSDAELAQELIDKVWAKLDISSWEAAIVVQAITRLKKELDFEPRL